ncbi:MauE/DoxX family redox-associated membrane protein [Cohnella mopanensis]|uniref:MauE/DoxX family redox-associated membrane protein n=1 Tax=Cohnella mopanensis TaxID=2911966 RepID=UPI001EF8EDFF|nr:MauE/DoxX family redox-associated membrane protein [Cohnella mopanensis]
MSWGVMLVGFVNVAMGYIFMRSAWEKCRNPLNFALYLQRFLYRLPLSGLRILVYAIISLESVLFLSFAIDLWNGFKTIAACSVLVVFTAFLIANRETIHQSGCSCFGDRSRLNRYPIARNLTLMGLCLLPWAIGFQSLDEVMTRVQIGIVAVLALLLYRGYTRQDKRMKTEYPQASHELPTLVLSYRASDFEEADRLLADTAGYPLQVLLDAPEWILAMKQRKWRSHIVVYDVRGDRRSGQTYLLASHGKGKLRKFSEWSSYTNSYLGGEFSGHGTFDNSSHSGAAYPGERDSIRSES